MTRVIRLLRSRWCKTPLLVLAVALPWACGGQAHRVEVVDRRHKSAAAPFAGGVSQPPGFLNRGVIVDTESRAVYLTAIEGIEAVDLRTGARRWLSTAAAKPLFARGERLLAQEDAVDPGVLHLALLDTRTGRLAVRCAPVELPGWARPSIEERTGASFSVGALDRDGRIQVLWFASLGVAGPGLREAHGNVEVDPASGAVRTVGPVPAGASGVGTSEGMKNGYSTGEVQAMVEARPVQGRFRVTMRRHRRSDGAELPVIAVGEAVDAPNLAFLVSADQRHVLVADTSAESADSAGPVESNRPEGSARPTAWAVLSIETGERVGALHEPPTEYLVWNGLLVRGGPPREFVGALDLATGREIWRRPLRLWWWQEGAR